MKRILVESWRLVAGLARPSGKRNLRRLRDKGEEPASFVIREATIEDVSELAQLHFATWNATYAPLMAKGPSVEIRSQQWHEQLDRNDPHWFCVVVENSAGRLVGFAQGNKSDNPDFEGELGKIYLLEAYQRVGLGSRLIGHVARRFRTFGWNSMWLYGDARNPSSLAWLALGAQKTDADPGNGNYGWNDLESLISR